MPRILGAPPPACLSVRFAFFPRPSRPSPPVSSSAAAARRPPPYVLRVLGTLLLALAAAGLCLLLHTPLPWMIGPILAVSFASMAGLPTASWAPLRNGGQWTIGAALGLYFTPEVTALVASLWWAIVLAIAWALALGTGFGLCLDRVHARHMPQLPPRTLRATTYFAGAIGGASEMTLLSERAGARTDLVAAAHSLRLVIVTVSIPFGLQWAGLHGLDSVPAALREVRWGGFALMAVATAAGAWLMRRLGRANPWFLGPLLVTAGISMNGFTPSAVPQWLSNAAQLVIAVSLGVRFSREFVHTAPRWLASVAAGTVAMIGACALFAEVLAWATGLRWTTLLLGTSPGGIAEMSITAKVLQLGVPVVTAFQVCRLVAVLLLTGPLFARLYGRR